MCTDTDIPEIMRNDDDAAAKGIDGIGQAINGGNIQAIGRLIQQEHIRPLDGQQGKDDPALLALGQRAHERGLGLAGQAIAAQLLAPILVILALVAVLVADEVQSRLGQVELLGRMLAVHAQLQMGVPRHDAGGGGELAGHETQQGGFADAVGADEGGAGIHVDAEVEVLVEVVFAVARVGEGHVVEGEDGWGQLFHVGEAEGEDAVFLHFLDEAVGLHLVEDLLAGFGLAHQVGVGAGRGDEFLDVGDFFLLLGVGFHLVGFLLRARFDVGVVVAAVVHELFHPHVDHVGADAVEEVHAVRDEDEGAVPFLEIFFQPHTRFEVEMGGGIVEE